MNHIRDKLPDMKARLNTLMGQAQQELNSFGDSAIFGDKNQVSDTLFQIYIFYLLMWKLELYSKAPLFSDS